MAGGFSMRSLGGFRIEVWLRLTLPDGTEMYFLQEESYEAEQRATAEGIQPPEEVHVMTVGDGSGYIVLIGGVRLANPPQQEPVRPHLSE